MKYDVITIGGGPSGAYASYLLAKEGFKVMLLDKGNPGGKVCTGIISEEIFQTFSLCRKSILKDISSVQFVAPSGISFTYEHATPFAYAVDRKAFDSALLKMAQEAGASFLSQATVTSAEVSKDGVKLGYEKNGQFTASAQALVLATGLNRKFLSSVGLKPPDSMQAAQIEIDDYQGEDQVKVFLGNNIAPGSFAWIVPIGNGKARIGMSTQRQIKPYFSRFMRALGISNGHLKVRSRPVPYGMAPRTYANRTLVIGDAAGQAKTTTGGGIYYGLLGAKMAVQTLKEAFSKGDLSEQYLQAYEKKWKERLTPEIEMGLRLRELFSTFTDEKINTLINFSRNDGVATLIRLQAKFDWHRTFILSLLKILSIKDFLSPLKMSMSALDSSPLP